MTRRARWTLLAVLLVAFAVAVVVAGQGGGPPPPATGAQRLGPDSGEAVPSYLARAGASLAALPRHDGAEVWALVAPSEYLDPAATARLAAGVRLAGVVLRVPLPGVQTALITRDLAGQRPGPEVATALRSAAAERARTAQEAPPGSRSGTVARAEATRLREGCACVVALLVRGDAAQLRDLAARPGVRAVHAASPGTTRPELAVAPLLPEQHDVVGPVPDDGPVPGAAPVPGNAPAPR